MLSLSLIRVHSCALPRCDIPGLSPSSPPAFFIPVPRTDCAFNALLIRRRSKSLWTTFAPLKSRLSVRTMPLLCLRRPSCPHERQNKLTAKIPQVICTEKQIRRYVLPNLYPVRLLHCQSSKSTTSIEHTFRHPWCWSSPVALPLICRRGPPLLWVRSLTGDCSFCSKLLCLARSLWPPSEVSWGVLRSLLALPQTLLASHLHIVHSSDSVNPHRSCRLKTR